MFTKNYLSKEQGERNREPDSPFLDQLLLDVEEAEVAEEKEFASTRHKFDSPFLYAFESEDQEVREPDAAQYEEGSDEDVEDEALEAFLDDDEEDLEVEEFDELDDEFEEDGLLEEDEFDAELEDNALAEFADETEFDELDEEPDDEELDDELEEEAEALEDEEFDEFDDGEEDENFDKLGDEEFPEEVEEETDRNLIDEEMVELEVEAFLDEPYEQALAGSPKRRVKHFLCSNADRAKVEGVLETSVTKDELKSAIETAIEEAVSLSSNAANALRRSRRHRLISYAGTTNQLFHEAFGTFPNYVPSWRPAGATWDRGDIVRVRLKRAVKILVGRSIKFFCWGPNQRPDFDWKPTSYSMYDAKKYTIYFGQGFWEALKNGDKVIMASSVLMSALAIYYDTVSYSGKRGRYGNSHCYARFVLRTNGFFDLPDRIRKSCLPALVSDGKVQKLLGTITKAIRLLRKANKSLKSQAQQELLTEMIEQLSWFFLDGHYGVKDAEGKETKASKRKQVMVRHKFIIKDRRLRARFRHNTRLYLSHQVSHPLGVHRETGSRGNSSSWIRLNIRNLVDSPASFVAETLVHEMLHMMRARFRGIEATHGRAVASRIPKQAAGALLDVHAFAHHRQAMEKHFLTLANFLKVERADASSWASLVADLVVEEVLAFIFHERVSLALAKIVIKFDPMQFLKRYLCRHWLQHPEHRAALNTSKGQKILSNMEDDLKELVNEIEKHVDG